ncbi:transcription factor domain-containing protein [Aspergillus saccharolyticus JOP 1030-1]|uniref:Fungal-specific transcription factor n=1 Tax=Aspergillus saccharolyticus JOP 1030-1 TaxID=1450539 RepID=A0A318Z6L0_9EURO|nr:fungal-specific transcription factor [Aspergillus saccharolyticus JOP 1030-1]PYH40413.1 fungal-specific transcription factor [Aspergillus saccharolyticus JOP 1030-1]
MTQSLSCTRCQAKKIRCNRADPPCDKCTTAGAQCTYLPRKQRTLKRRAVHDKDILREILRRLERLEDHCRLGHNTADEDDIHRSMSVESDNISTPGSSSTNELPPSAQSPAGQAMVQSLLARVKDDRIQSRLHSHVFCAIDKTGSRFFENERCIKALDAAIARIEQLDPAPTELSPPAIPKETAKKWINQYFSNYQFEGFRIPLGKDFMMAMPELMESPHVRLDATSQIIYYNVLFQSFMLDGDEVEARNQTVQALCGTCLKLAEEWLGQIQNTSADLFAAFMMISMTLESCDSDLSWKIFKTACPIARALGYFSVDEDQHDCSERSSRTEEVSPHEGIERNRKRFEFWHILRTESHFRLSFGKPAIISGGSWAVNFPDPTITGVDHASTRFIQIHFLASMRLTIVTMRYLDIMATNPDTHTRAYNDTIDGLIAEVQKIMSDWNPEELLNSTTNRIDTWFCVDILFSSYKMLIVFYQSKPSHRDSHRLPYHTVEIARKSLQRSRSLMEATPRPYWGISLILLHQSIPLFVLFHDILGCYDREGIEADVALVTWFDDYIEVASRDRMELKCISLVVREMTRACQEVARGR